MTALKYTGLEITDRCGVVAERRGRILAAEGLWASRGGRVILRDVSLEIRDLVRPGVVTGQPITGQIVALLGPSGIGKTLLSRILAGLEAPEAGRVLVGEPGTAVRGGTVGFVAQDSPLFAHRTVLGNLRVAAAAAGLARAEADERAGALLARLGLRGRAESYPGVLSGGERQRVAIAQQLIGGRSLIIMDEPFSGLDPAAQEDVADLIEGLAGLDELNTFVIVTHDVAAAVGLADTLWLLGRERRDRAAGASSGARAAEGRAEGARIVRTIDLVSAGLAWRKDAASRAGRALLVQEVRAGFRGL